MDALIRDNPACFPIFFALLWFVVTTMLGFLSGWYALARRYPNQIEAPLLSLRGRSGMLSGVSMKSILNLHACPSGLRIGMLRVFGPFCRDFFVPWDAIYVVRYERFFQRRVKLTFGNPIVGTLTLPAEVADQLARAASQSWPEGGAFPEESKGQAAARIFKQWLLSTCVASTFFIVAPRLVGPSGTNFPPIAVAILFPAIVFGIGSVIRYLMRGRW